MSGRFLSSGPSPCPSSASADCSARWAPDHSSQNMGGQCTRASEPIQIKKGCLHPGMKFLPFSAHHCVDGNFWDIFLIHMTIFWGFTDVKKSTLLKTMEANGGHVHQRVNVRTGQVSGRLVCPVCLETVTLKYLLARSHSCLDIRTANID